MLTDIPIELSNKKINTQVYSEEYLRLYEKRQSLLINRFASKVKIIDDYISGGNILDVGCSTGLFLQSINTFSKNKWNKYGIDINKKSIDIAKQKIIGEILHTDLHHQHFRNNFFDVITCFDVLEHDVNLKGNLKQIRRILKSDGLLIIQLPNYKSIMAILCGDNWDWWAVPDHVYHFSLSSLNIVLNENGFKQVRFYTWEDKNDFLKNIQGTIKNKLSNYFFINKLIVLLSYPILIVVFYFVKIIEYFYPVGGLSVIIATKNNSSN